MRRRYHLRPQPAGTRHAWDVHRLLMRAASIPVEQQADPRHPVVIDPDERLMDGMHRVVRALLEGRTHVPGVRLTVLPPPDHTGVTDYDALPMDAVPLGAAPPAADVG